MVDKSGSTQIAIGYVKTTPMGSTLVFEAVLHFEQNNESNQKTHKYYQTVQTP